MGDRTSLYSEADSLMLRRCLIEINAYDRYTEYTEYAAYSYSALREGPLPDHVSAREARARFGEITDRVRYTGAAVVVEKQGKPFVAVISLEDLAALERLRRDERRAAFSRLAAFAARATSAPEPTEDEIVEAVKRTRDDLSRSGRGTGA